MTDWEFVKHRTAADGVVWRSTDGLLYKRTGDASVDGEAHCQRLLAELGYPVPELVETGHTDGVHYFVERSVGSASLHELALSEAGHVGQDVIEQAVEISTRLLTAQARNPLPGGPAQLREWFERAGFAGNVFAENPDLDTPRVHEVVTGALRRLGEVPMCRSHLDYGLPNAFPGGVIDWQHHSVWQYRRTLLTMGLEQYESSGAIHTGTFPTLAAFTERLAQPVAGHP